MYPFKATICLLSMKKKTNVDQLSNNPKINWRGKGKIQLWKSVFQKLCIFLYITQLDCGNGIPSNTSWSYSRRKAWSCGPYWEQGGKENAGKTSCEDTRLLEDSKITPAAQGTQCHSAHHPSTTPGHQRTPPQPHTPPELAPSSLACAASS